MKKKEIIYPKYKIWEHVFYKDQYSEVYWIITCIEYLLCPWWKKCFYYKIWWKQQDFEESKIKNLRADAHNYYFW